jgi:hypothetical protein
LAAEPPETGHGDSAVPREGRPSKRRAQAARGAFLLVPFLWACKEKEPGCRAERLPGVGGGGTPLLLECLINDDPIVFPRERGVDGDREGALDDFFQPVLAFPHKIAYARGAT